MRKHMKRVVSLLTAVIMLLSMSIVVSAVERVDHGEVDIPESNCSYTWEYYDNDVFKIKPTSNVIFIQNSYYTDYMQTAFTKDTQVIIDFSSSLNNGYVRIYGYSCPANEIIFTGDNADKIKLLDMYGFNNLTSVKLKQGMDLAMNFQESAITSTNIFQGGKISHLYLRNCYELTHVVVPEGIAHFSLYNCTHVESIDIPESLQGLYLGNLPSLVYFNVPETLTSCNLYNVGVTDIFIPNSVEYFKISSPDLEHATIEDGRTRINAEMFYDCPNLTDVYIPDTVTSIEYGAFFHCWSLQEIELPESLTTINAGAFTNCGIQYIDIPRGVTSIEYETFSGCADLSTVTIPNSVTKIDDTAFKGCYDLKDIYYEGSRYQWENISIYNHETEDVSEKTIDEVFPRAKLHFWTFIYKGPEDFTGPEGSFAEFSVVADGDPNDFTYQWKYFWDGEWIDIDDESATTPNLTFLIIDEMDGMDVCCAVTDSEGMTLTSTSAKLTVNGKCATIVEQPEDFSCCEGDLAIFLVVAEGDGLKYQWKVLKPGAEAWVNCSVTDGAKSDILTIEAKASRNNCKYQCIITDKYGNKIATDPVTLTIGVQLEILEQPECFEGYEGEYATFTVVAQGEDLKYQWQVDKNGWSNCSVNDGAKTDTLTLEIKPSRDGYCYRCIITDKYGAKVISEEAMLGMDTALRIAKEPVDFSGTVGQIASFTVEAKGVGLKYQWQVLKNGTWTNCSKNDGAKTNTLSQEIKDSRNGSVYHCVITDKYGNSKISDEVTLTISSEIKITREPESQDVPEQAYAEFIVEAEGEGLKYQWQVLKNGVWTNCSKNDGAKTDTLTILSLASRDGFQYHCVITDKYGTVVETRTVTLYVMPEEIGEPDDMDEDMGEEMDEDDFSDVPDSAVALVETVVTVDAETIETAETPVVETVTEVS